MSAALTPAILQRYARQILLAPIGGAGQQKLRAATVLLHGDAPLCATYLAAAGLGRLLVSGPDPELAGRDPEFRLESARPGERADLVVSMDAGTPGDLWAGAVGRRVVVGGDPVAGTPDPAARAVAEILAAGEAARRLIGLEPHAYDFEI